MPQSKLYNMLPQGTAPSPFRQNSIRNLLNNAATEKPYFGIAMTPQNFNLAPTPINMQLHQHMLERRQEDGRKMSGRDQELVRPTSEHSVPGMMQNLFGGDTIQPLPPSLGITPPSGNSMGLDTAQGPGSDSIKDKLVNNLLNSLKGSSSKNSDERMTKPVIPYATRQTSVPLQMQKSRDSNPPGQSKGSALSDGNISFKDLAKFQVQQVLAASKLEREHPNNLRANK